MQAIVTPEMSITEYVEKFRNFTDLALCAEKLVYKLFGKADLCMKRVKSRAEYTVYEISATLQFMTYATWHGKIRIPGLMATGVITSIDTVLNKVEVVFKDFDINVDSKPDLDLFKIKCNTYANTTDVNVPFNRCQKQAIYSIVNGVHGSVPFILWGPPGTGKTVTLVECVRQLLKKSPKNRILVCTPSNTAADLMALKILDSKAADPKILRRYYALGKHVSERNCVLDNVTCMENVSCFGEMIGIFSVDNPVNMAKYRVFVTTLVFCSNIEQIEPGFFSHIFIDEAAQSIEPETLIPITRFATESTRVVLSGDHQQLGAVITTQFLNNHFNSKFKSCAQSLMERLMTTYNKTVYTDKRTTCKLQDSYRCHAAILRFPSNKFYGGALTAVSKERKSFCKWKYLPNKNDFPIIFHLIDGATESREIGSTSCANLMEVDVTVTYVELLLKSGVKPEDIGVVSPYKNQTRKIRERINPDITVDSVERYQGSERRVIIATTARTETIGFLGDNKRVNTLITRAMDLLIVVTTDSLIVKMAESPACQFLRFLNFFHYCKENRAVTGHIVNKDPSIDLEKRLEKFGYEPHNQKLFRKHKDYNNTAMQSAEDYYPQQASVLIDGTSEFTNNFVPIDSVNSPASTISPKEDSISPAVPPPLVPTTSTAPLWLFSTSLPCSPRPSSTPDFTSLLSATAWPLPSTSSIAISSTNSSSPTVSLTATPITFNNIFQSPADPVRLPLFQENNCSSTSNFSGFAEMQHDPHVDPEISFSKQFRKQQQMYSPLRSLNLNEGDYVLETSNHRQTTASRIMCSKSRQDSSTPKRCATSSRVVSANSSHLSDGCSETAKDAAKETSPEIRKALLDSARQFSALLQSDDLLLRANGQKSGGESRKQEVLSTVPDHLKGKDMLQHWHAETSKMYRDCRERDRLMKY